MTPVARLAVSWAWQLLIIGTACAVAFEHGAALRRLGVPRRQFTAQVLGGFRSTVTSIRGGKISPEAKREGESPLARHPAPQNATVWLLTKAASLQLNTIHIGGYARAPKSRRQLRYVIRLSALLAELCRIVHR
jgi:hypothetical protein